MLELTRKPLGGQFVIRTCVPVSLRSQFLQMMDFEWPKDDVVPLLSVPPLFFGSAEKLLKLTHKPLGGQLMVRTFVPVSLRSQFLQTMEFEWLKGERGLPPCLPLAKKTPGVLLPVSTLAYFWGFTFRNFRGLGWWLGCLCGGWLSSKKVHVYPRNLSARVTTFSPQKNE